MTDDRYYSPVKNTPISKPHHSIHNISIPGIQILMNLPHSCKAKMVQPEQKLDIERQTITHTHTHTHTHIYIYIYISTQNTNNN